MSPNIDSNLKTLISRLIHQAQVKQHRTILALCGTSGWLVEHASFCLQQIPSPIHWLGHDAPQNIPETRPKQAEKLLGSEINGLVFDTRDGFHPDAFGAATGSLKSGGILILLIPDSQDSEEWKLRSHQRIINILLQSPEVTLYREGEAVPKLTAVPETVSHRAQTCPPPYRTQDQQQAVEAIHRVALGHRRRPLVLTSDRGRGKSAALGIAAAQLIEKGLKQIIITAPRLSATDALFTQAAQISDPSTVERGRVTRDQRYIRFIAPDELMLDPVDADLVLIDEAAALPTPMLNRFLERYARIVFSTTIHGYEGSGRGFIHRFEKSLESKCPGWKKIQLNTPIRWAEGDPLEHLTFATLLLDAEPNTLITSSNNYNFEYINRSNLSEKKLRSLFGLLIGAHYRTRPSDLHTLLDDPNLSISALQNPDTILATAWSLPEGNIDPELSSKIHQGHRRIPGHLIPQSLAAHLGIENAPRLNYIRIIRIAVHPEVQNQGYGSRLIQHLIDENKHVDVIGTSFGATPQLIRFWSKLGFQPVRVGLTRNASSGHHSVIMLYPVSKQGQVILKQSTVELGQQLTFQLSENLVQLEPELVIQLLPDTLYQKLSKQELKSLHTFAHHQRNYETILGPIWKLAINAISDENLRNKLDQNEQNLLVSKVIQKRCWTDTAKLLNYSGRREVIETLRGVVGKFIT